MNHRSPWHGCSGSRREFLWQVGAGFGGVALSSVMAEDGVFGAMDAAALPHVAARAKRCIFLFMFGGPPSMDTFDYKPELQKRNGETVDTETRRGKVEPNKLLASKRSFKQYGESGLWCSDAFPHIAKHMDELCLIKSLYTDSFIHGSAVIQANTGRILQGHPSMGSWLSYGLGTDNQNLPSFVVMLDPRGGPISGAPNWSSGYIPASHQGTVFRSKGDPILHLSNREGLTREMEREHHDALARLNAVHLKERFGRDDLEARIKSYELAYRMQISAPEVTDLAGESEKTMEMYGIFDKKPDHKWSVGPAHFGRQCLTARRLIERGTRFVQIYSGGGVQQQSWDAHAGQEVNLQIHAPEIDRPIDGLLTDLKQRGLLDETLVVWGGEFGRQPGTKPNYDVTGRDHNPKGFLYWMAGGGVKPGFSYGETDELGHAAEENPRHLRDLHATILHLMGIDHEQLTYFYDGLDQKLTGLVPAEPIHEVVA
ncbi:MAG: DUF1501 domain-containing protein [Roseibacillus sp.]|nr:DUF1501 domain-containing protein [Roseibacillus sp.]